MAWHRTSFSFTSNYSDHWRMYASPWLGELKLFDVLPINSYNKYQFSSIVGEYTWWCHQMETFSALLTLCAGNSPVTGEFPYQRPVTRSFDVFFDLRLNQQLSKQWRRCWFETPWRSLWRTLMTSNKGNMPNFTWILSLRVSTAYCNKIIESKIEAGTCFTGNSTFVQELFTRLTENMKTLHSLLWKTTGDHLISLTRGQ